MYFKTIALATLIALSTVACGQKSAEEKVAEQTKEKVYPLSADERSMAAINAKAYFEKEWITAGNARGQLNMCRPSDSNFNGMVSCFGFVPKANGGYVETKMFCGYKPELVGCSNEDTVK